MGRSITGLGSTAALLQPPKSSSAAMVGRAGATLIPPKSPESKPLLVAATGDDAPHGSDDRSASFVGAEVVIEGADEVFQSLGAPQPKSLLAAVVVAGAFGVGMEAGMDGTGAGAGSGVPHSLPPHGSEAPKFESPAEGAAGFGTALGFEAERLKTEPSIVEAGAVGFDGGGAKPALAAGEVKSSRPLPLLLVVVGRGAGEDRAELKSPKPSDALLAFLTVRGA